MKRAFTLIELLVVIAIVGILAAIVFSAASSQSSGPTPEVSLPDPTNYAVDSAGVLTTDQLSQLNTKLAALDGQNGQLAVAIVKTTAPLTIEQYGIQLADKWKVGHAGKDDGVILIVATQDRKIRIEVGTGAEAKITDADAGRIIRDVISPKLHAGDWLGGIEGGIDSINTNLQST